MSPKWRTVALLFFIGALNYGDRTAISSVFPLLRSEMGATDLQLGLIGTLFLWSYGVASPLAGVLADRHSRSRLIASSLAAWSVVMLITAFLASIQQVLAARVVLGLAEAAYLPAAIALIADWHGTESRATAIGIHSAGLTAGLIMGGAGTGWLAEHFGWRFAFIALGAGGLLMAMVAWFFLHDREGAKPSTKNSAPFWPVMRSILAVPSLLIVLAESMLVSIGTWSFLNWLPLYFKENYGLGLAAAGLAGTSVLQGAAVIGGIGGGRLSDQWASRHPRRRQLFQTVAYFVSAPFLLAFMFQPALGVLNLCVFVFGLVSRAGAANQTPLVCDLLPAEKRSTALGLMNALNTIAGGLGVLVAGLLKESLGLGGAFGGVSIIMLLSAALTGIGYRYFIQRDLERAHA